MAIIHGVGDHDRQKNDSKQLKWLYLELRVLDLYSGRDSGDRVEWLHKGRSGIHIELCDYTPETLMAIYDVETGGNPVDS